MIDKESKRNLLSELEKNGLVNFACKKAGVSRATYYRWREKNDRFRADSDAAISHGRESTSDLAEAVLIQLMKDKNLAAVKHWLSHNSLRYKPVRESRGTMTFQKGEGYGIKTDENGTALERLKETFDGLRSASDIDLTDLLRAAAEANLLSKELSKRRSEEADQ
jgi:hypothetical protein